MDPLPVYIGWDQRDALAFEVCVASLRKHASIPIRVIPLKHHDLRRRPNTYWREYHVDARGQMWDRRDGKPFSTGFSYTRFLVPMLENYDSHLALFCDADMLWRADIVELVELWDSTLSLMCVQHDHRPAERDKMDGVIQTVYDRKNWSSLMLMAPWRLKDLTTYRVNNATRDWLHGLAWVADQDIGALSESWNWLDGWSDPAIDPKVVHFTRGTPDMQGYENTAYADEWRAYAKDIERRAALAALFHSAA